MSPATERRLLQVVVTMACGVSLSASLFGLWRGAAWLGRGAVLPTDLDSHFRYLSGIFLVMGLAFVATIPRIESAGPRLRLLGTMVVAGGLARLASLALVGTPSTGHLVGLCVELGVVPTVLVWQARVARRYRTPSSPAPASTDAG